MVTRELEEGTKGENRQRGKRIGGAERERERKAQLQPHIKFSQNRANVDFKPKVVRRNNFILLFWGAAVKRKF